MKCFIDYNKEGGHMKWYYWVILGIIAAGGYWVAEYEAPKEEVKQVQTKVQVCPEQKIPEIKERVIEIPVEKIVEVPVEKIIEVPVEKVVERLVYPEPGCHADFAKGRFMAVGTKTKGYTCTIDLRNNTVHQLEVPAGYQKGVQFVP